MKFIIIGLGNFGTSLAMKLTRSGHEVIGVDSKMNKVEAIKDSITHAVCLNSTDPTAITNLPLKDADVVIVCIGEDEGANIMTTALIKQYKVKRLISRAVTPLHETVLEAMGIDEIVRPEEEAAEHWAKKLNIMGVIDSYDLPGDYSIVEILTPAPFVGRSLQEIGMRRLHNIIVLTTIRTTEERNILGITRKIKKVKEMASADTVLEKGDIIVLYGARRDIEKLLKIE